MKIHQLQNNLQQALEGKILDCKLNFHQITIEADAQNYLEVCQILKNDEAFRFEEMIDLCGMDYLSYGEADWETHQATSLGFERAVNKDVEKGHLWSKPRFAAVVQFLSVTLNQRVRVRVFANDDDYPVVPSITELWPSANWFEREAFDLFGITFEGHPDLRRILTDYGFVGHPFRKDFPLIGNVELRYDATEHRCVYEPVSIEPRTLVPKVIRDDARKSATQTETE